MADTLPYFAAETGTYSTTGPAVALSGTAAALGAYPARTFAAAAADTTIAFDSTNTCTVTVVKDAANYKRYIGAVWTDASPDTVSLATATLEGSTGTISNGDSVTVFASLPSLATDLAVANPYLWQMSLSADDAAPVVGYKSGAATGFAGTVTAVIIDCDPNNEPSTTDLVIDIYRVDRSSGARTSLLSTSATIATGGNNQTSGSLSGTSGVLTMTADTWLQPRVVQTGTTVRAVSIRVLITRS
jgi:hypothetical protein